MEETLIPVVEIKTPGRYYLYPKKRPARQSLIELDETGYYFYSLLKKCKSEDEMKSIICCKYNLDKQFEEDVLEDIKSFKSIFRDNGYLINKYADVSSNYQINNSNSSNISDRSFGDQFFQMQSYYIKNRKPFRFFIEITYNCNLRCRHCYRGEEVKNNENAAIYMDKETIFELLDEIEEVGAVEVFITGGEPFTHPDIYEILEYASGKNLVVTVLSNGNYLADSKNVEKLRNLDLFDIRISVYGEKENHDKMTTIKGSYRKSVQALKNVHDILALGTAVFVVTRENYDDCEAIISYFKNMDINISINAMLTPTAKGDLSPTLMRISGEQYGRMISKFNLPLSGSRCSAGISRFRISPNGNVNPCELLPGYTFGNINEKSLKNIMDGEIRKDFVDMFEEILEKHSCNLCEYKTECNFCPALFLHENGDFNKLSKYLCEITRQKHKVLAERGVI